MATGFAGARGIGTDRDFLRSQIYMTPEELIKQLEQGSKLGTILPKHKHALKSALMQTVREQRSWRSRWLSLLEPRFIPLGALTVLFVVVTIGWSSWQHLPGTPSSPDHQQIIPAVTKQDIWNFSVQGNKDISTQLFRNPSAGFGNVGGGTLSNISPMVETGKIGLSTGGAKDIANFRENIKNGYLPLPTDVTYEGLFYDYFFDTGATEACAKLFCPSYSMATSKDPFSGMPETYLAVGLNSGIDAASFTRKKLNLVVVLDISGSMGAAFDTYYYDQSRGTLIENRERETKSKMQIANESIAAMLSHLRPDDRIGVVLFDDTASVAKPLAFVRETDMDRLTKHILEIRENGGTNQEAGITAATQLFDAFRGVSTDEYENRMIVVTDAMPNTGDTSEGGFMNLIKQNAADHIYTTAIGVGLDFNTELVEAMLKNRGANYYSIHSSDEFKKRLDDEFDFMVTPLVFNLKLTLEARGYAIEHVYGSPEANLTTGELMVVNTLFPSTTKDNATRGGIILLKLKKTGEDGQVTLSASYENRAGHSDGNTVTVRLRDDDRESYDNSGIRKAILLARYANLLKRWMLDARYTGPRPMTEDPSILYRCGLNKKCLGPIEPPDNWMLGQWERRSMPLTVTSEHKEIFKKFSTYFFTEAQSLNDVTLKRESDILNTLIKK